MKTVSFIGHRDAASEIRERLMNEIENVIIYDKADIFLVGHQGGFDRITYSVLKELKQKYPHIKYSVVLAYMPDYRIAELYGGDTIYPEGLESVPGKLSILKRNEWMIKHSDILICYVTRITGGAAKFMDMALKMGKKVINIERGDKL